MDTLFVGVTQNFYFRHLNSLYLAHYNYDGLVEMPESAELAVALAQEEETDAKDVYKEMLPQEVLIQIWARSAANLKGSPS